MSRFNWHHKRAFALLVGVIALDAVTGSLISFTEHVPVWHGVYCATGLTTTDGCDIPFTTWPSYALAWLAMVLFVPLWGAVFSFLTAGLAADHVDRKTDRQTAEIKDRLS